MKTPEELATDYVQAWWGPREDNMTLATRQAFVAGYQAAAPQWISVKDRLPEENQTVLIYTDKHETYMARIYDNNEAWPISNSCGCCGREEKFTHWMPLPPPPTE